MKIDRRTAAVVHLDALRSNVRNIRARLGPGVALVAVLKGDGYGHGIAGIYPTLHDSGVDGYAVAVWEEGAALREAGARTERVMLLGDTWDDQLCKLLDYDLTPTIFSVETARKLNDLAAERGVVRDVELKLDTGMSRIGFPADARCIEPIRQIAALEHLHISGTFTHFSRADETDRPETARQLRAFLDTADALRRVGVDPGTLHAANSPAILLHPDAQLGAVRAGDVLFGLCPVDEGLWPDTGLREVMTWHSYVALVKTLPAGTAVGYGGTYVTQRRTVLATIPVGFADGYSRELSNRGGVYIRGQFAPIRGRVCMDQFMVDVTDIPGVKRGDFVELLGEHMTILKMADLLDRNVDEIVCGVSRRVPRVYTDGEE